MKNMVQRYNMLHYNPNKNTKRQNYFIQFDNMLHILLLIDTKTGTTLQDCTRSY